MLIWCQLPTFVKAHPKHHGDTKFILISFHGFRRVLEICDKLSIANTKPILIHKHLKYKLSLEQPTEYFIIQFATNVFDTLKLNCV